jgi:hypothetical protein
MLSNPIVHYSEQLDFPTKRKTSENPMEGVFVLLQINSA